MVQLLSESTKELRVKIVERKEYREKAESKILGLTSKMVEVSERMESIKREDKKEFERLKEGLSTTQWVIL